MGRSNFQKKNDDEHMNKKKLTAFLDFHDKPKKRMRKAEERLICTPLKKGFLQK